MPDMTPEERRLYDKYNMGAAPDPNNPHALRALAGERIAGLAFARDSGPLFDPTRCPRMHDLGRTALRDFHAAMAEGDLLYFAGDAVGDFERFDPDNMGDDPALLVHVVGSREVYVCRAPKPRSAFDMATIGPDRSRRDDSAMAKYLRVAVALWHNNANWRDPCNVRVASNCRGPTEVLPYDCAAVMLVFQICTQCLEYAVEAAQTGHELSVLEALMAVGIPPDTDT